MYSGSWQREGVDQGRVGRGWVCGVEGGAQSGEGVGGCAERLRVRGAASGATGYDVSLYISRLPRCAGQKSNDYFK